MCIAVLSLAAQEYPVIIGLNRDEFRDRPTLQSAAWPEDAQIVGGRDGIGQGTWMGVSVDGRIGIITNFRDPKSYVPGKESRGAIVRDYLLSGDSPEVFIDKLRDRAGDYNPFNVLLGNTERLVYFTNHNNATETIADGVHALSNGLLDEPWPKVQRGKEKLSALLRTGSEIHADAVFEILADRTRPSDETLPNTGVGLEIERAVGPIFIDAPERNYGTRSSTVLMVYPGGEVKLVECTYEADGKRVYVTHSFRLGDPQSLVKEVREELP